MADVTSTTGACTSRLVFSTNSPYRQLIDLKEKIMSSSSSTTTSTPKHPAAVARRNARERNRVRQVNMGFVTLRNHIPQPGSKSKKLSKVETLRQAASYIQHLREMLQVDESMSNSAFATNCLNEQLTSGFFFAATPTPPPTSNQETIGNNYFGSNHHQNSYTFSSSDPNPHLGHPSKSHFSHLKISPSSSTDQSADSPRSTSFISSSNSSSTGGGYDCVSPAQQLRSYNQNLSSTIQQQQQSEFLENRIAYPGKIEWPTHCQPTIPHSMQMYS